MAIFQSTLYVCQCCMLEHANGECCPDDQHGGDGVAPWSDVDFAVYGVTMGLLARYHEEGCDMGAECECALVRFSGAPCNGCGSTLAGERHAFTLWRES